MMSYWTFSDVFEEQGIVKQPFYGGFGLIAAGGIPKPSFYAMAMLHHLGEQRIDNSSPNVLVTKAADGSLEVAVWNLVNPGSSGAAKTVKLDFKAVGRRAGVVIQRVDEDHGNTLGLYEKMGKPQYPTQQQIDSLRKQSQLGKPEVGKLKNGALTLQLPVNSLVVVRVK
jgi:xylan 1,4-beta-xylosidase